MKTLFPSPGALCPWVNDRIIRYSAKPTSISEANGQTWSEPRPIPIGDHTGSAAQLAVTRNGVLVLAYPRLFKLTPGEIKLGLFFNYEIVSGPKAEPRGAIFPGFHEKDLVP